MTLVAREVGDLVELVRSRTRCRVRAGGSKPALAADAEAATLVELGALRGVVEHEPKEFTVTVKAATPIAELETLLESAGQFLPFDPLLVEAGATAGGTVASGLSGSGRLLYGGVRDFVLGVRLVDGTGSVIRGGGKVVKNAAGFDLPKLVVGSLGCFGIVTELTFKVFPRPESWATVTRRFGSTAQAWEALLELRRSPLELAALDLEGPGTLWVRLGGRRRALQERAERVRRLLGGGEILVESREAEAWKRWRELVDWRGERSTVKVPLSPRRLPALDAALPAEVLRRYGAAGQVAWLGWPDSLPLASLAKLLDGQGLEGLRVDGGEGARRLGRVRGGAAVARARRALDPDSLFPPPE